MAYPTVSDVYTYAGITDTDDATLVSSLLDYAISIVETYTGRVFDAVGSDAATRYFNAEYDVDGQTLYLDRDLLSISVDTDSHLQTGTGSTDVSLDASDVTYLPPNDTPYYAIKIKGSSGKVWTYPDDPENALSVTGVWGYSSTPPDNISLCIKRLTKWLFDQRVTSVDLDRPLLTGDGVTIMPMKLPADVTSILNNYKRPRFTAPV